MSGSSGGLSTNSSAGRAGNVVVETGRLQLLDGSAITADGLGNGAAGDIIIAADSVLLDGFAETPFSQNPLFSRISSSLNSEATGQTSSIIITANSLSLRDGATIRTNTSSSTNGGNIRINARDRVELIGSSSPETSSVSTISSSTFPGATGSGGDINITVSNGQLSLLNGGQILAFAGAGRGGDIEIDANAIEVIGIAAFPANATGLRLSSAITSSSVNGADERTVVGDAGNITIRTNQLSLRESGTITAGTSGQGRGGDIRINPRDPEAPSSVEIIGISPSTAFPIPSSLAANTLGASYR